MALYMCNCAYFRHNLVGFRWRVDVWAKKHGSRRGVFEDRFGDIKHRITINNVSHDPILDSEKRLCSTLKLKKKRVDLCPFSDRYKHCDLDLAQIMNDLLLVNFV